MTTKTEKLPANAAATEIVRLRSINADIDEQLRVLRETKMGNSEIIGNLGTLATWEDEDSYVTPGPEQAPDENEEAR